MNAGRAMQRGLWTAGIALALAGTVAAQDEYSAIGGETSSPSGNSFGFSIAKEGDRVLIGSPAKGSRAADKGSLALCDVRTGVLAWLWLDPLGTPGDRMGSAVALYGARALVGIPNAGDKGSFSGAACIVDSNHGTQLWRLSPDDGMVSDHFGSAVVLSDKVAIVGTSRMDGLGAVYFFEAATGQQTAKLTSSFWSTGNDRFGSSLALSGTRLAVGASLASRGLPYSGAAYLYNTVTKTWVRELRASDPQSGSWFGRSLAFRESVQLAVGAPRADGGKGAVYVYNHLTGEELAKITVPGLEANDCFGWSIVYTGNKLLIGAPGDDEAGPNAGALYWLDPAQPSSYVKLLPPDVDGHEYCGVSVAGSGSFLLGGAPRALGEPGAVLVFTTLTDCNDNAFPDDDDITLGISLDADGDGVPDECQCHGENYCQSNPNSTGAAAHITWSGSLSIDANDLVLRADHCPANQPGLFFYGPNAASVAFGNGWRCVGGTLRRLAPIVTTAAGLASKPIDYAHLPPSGTIAPGSSWRFQFWYRDPQGGGAHFNLTDGLTLQFCE